MSWTYAIGAALALSVLLFCCACAPPRESSVSFYQDSRPVWCLWTPQIDWRTLTVKTESPYSERLYNGCFASKTGCELAPLRDRWHLAFVKRPTGAVCGMCNWG